MEETPGDSEEQGAWQAAVCGVAESQTRLADSTTSTHGRKNVEPQHTYRDDHRVHTYIQ